MAGEKVIVRDAAGRVLLRRVWKANERKVYITTEEIYADLTSGRPAPYPVGFPREDVFAFSASTQAAVEEGSRPTPAFWKSLRQWS